MPSLRSIGLLALLVLLGACQSAPNKRALQYLNHYGFGKKYYGNAEEENYATVGDSVQYQDVLHAGEISGTQKVDIDGTILMPEVGIVHVAGFTRSDIESVLQERYSVYYESTDIVVQIKTQGKKYFIFGEVGKEGEVKHPGDLTIFEAVMSAGPSENSANLGRVRLMRPDPIDPAVWTININDMLDRADMTFNMQVQEYDIIFVPATMLAEFAYFIDDLLFPVEQLLRGALGPLLGYGRGGRGRGRGRGAGVGGGSLFGGN